MTDTKHTPGPWYALNNCIREQSTDGIIARVTDGEHPNYAMYGEDEKDANAAFIARAANSHYELLEALEMWRDKLKGPGDVDMQQLLHRTDDAIKKARGES